MAEFGDPRLPARFWVKVAVRENGCWEWTACRTKAGYGQFLLGARPMRYSHRLTYQTLTGETPRGLELDHLCRNRACCNPAHLELVTHQENCRRGALPQMMREASPGAARERAKTHCPQGHPYNEENTYRHKRGRMCRICQKASRAASWERKKRLRACAA
jgi:hypothetical protein